MDGFFPFRAQEIVKCRIVKSDKEKEIVSYPHPHLNSPSQYTPKGWRIRDRLAVSVFIITCTFTKYLTKVARKFNCSGSNYMDKGSYILKYTKFDNLVKPHTESPWFQYVINRKMMMNDSLFGDMMQQGLPGIFATLPLQKCNCPILTTYIPIAVVNHSNNQW